MKKFRLRQLYPPQNFRRKLLNYLGVNNRGMVSRPSPGQFTATALKAKVGLDRRVTTSWLAAHMPYYVHKGKNGTTYKYFVAADFTEEVVARLNEKLRSSLLG